jgi:hypothetical protein
MKAIFTGVFLLALCFFVLASGCIPSSPAPVPVDKPAPAKKEAAAASETKQHQTAEGISTLNVPLQVQGNVTGAISMPLIKLVPQSVENTYKLEGTFPVKGIAIDGALVLQPEGKWYLSGKFTSVYPSFKPGAPVYQPMGILQPREGQGLEVVQTSQEGLILFAVPMPSPDAEKSGQPEEHPFALTFDASPQTVFSVMITPF